ncbi:hypothetical protein GCM10009557_72910 [Virgisporangium ochraceum]|uniref:Uncharacterized protein n=1 Tax=Virgisporangium ochraceum TaxID=65505 RepID=A0A8J3ZZ12_9ACTN|nr:hypothetical protein [Virgisporangium ochraceum]GIJ72662.1 hypothetical protein Voc01_075790 [Virgisporangium ochraceum]
MFDGSGGDHTEVAWYGAIHVSTAWSTPPRNERLSRMPVDDRGFDHDIGDACASGDRVDCGYEPFTDADAELFDGCQRLRLLDPRPLTRRPPCRDNAQRQLP